MQFVFSSKTVELTDKVKSFMLEKVERLQKFSSLGLNQLHIVIDRVKRGGKTTSEAQVEVVAQVKGARFAFKEVGDNLYQAFYRVFHKVEQKLGKVKGERRQK